MVSNMSSSVEFNPREVADLETLLQEKDACGVRGRRSGTGYRRIVANSSTTFEI